jgi:hypothetical protein
MRGGRHRLGGGERGEGRGMGGGEKNDFFVADFQSKIRVQSHKTFLLLFASLSS